MTNNGEMTLTAQHGKILNIPAGYHNGSGTVATSAVYNAGIGSLISKTATLKKQ